MASAKALAVRLSVAATTSPPGLTRSPHAAQEERRGRRHARPLPCSARRRSSRPARPGPRPSWRDSRSRAPIARRAGAATSMLRSAASMPTTVAPSRVSGSDSRPPPQPISSRRTPSSGRSPPPSRPKWRRIVSRMKAEPDGVEDVQRLELALGVPPVLGHGGEPGDFGVVDACRPPGGRGLFARLVGHAQTLGFPGEIPRFGNPLAGLPRQGRTGIYTRLFARAAQGFAGKIAASSPGCGCKDHGPHRHEIRRHLGRRPRAHPQRRAPGQARGRRRPRGRRRRLGHGRRDQPAGQLVPPARRAARRARIRRGRRHRRAGDDRPAGDRAAGAWACKARSWQGWQIADRAPTTPMPRRGSKAIDTARADRAACKRGEVAGDRRASRASAGRTASPRWAAAARTRRRWRWRRR